MCVCRGRRGARQWRPLAARPGDCISAYTKARPIEIPCATPATFDAAPFQNDTQAL